MQEWPKYDLVMHSYMDGIMLSFIFYFPIVAWMVSCIVLSSVFPLLLFVSSSFWPGLLVLFV